MFKQNNFLEHYGHSTRVSDLQAFMGVVAPKLVVTPKPALADLAQSVLDVSAFTSMTTASGRMTGKTTTQADLFKLTVQCQQDMWRESMNRYNAKVDLAITKEGMMMVDIFGGGLPVGFIEPRKLKHIYFYQNLSIDMGFAAMFTLDVWQSLPADEYCLIWTSHDGTERESI